MFHEEEELRAKLDQPARTLSDRVAILDARDKYLRLHRERQTNIETAKAVLGSCPDMCPEYERYWREENKQLSSLELLNNEPDPYAMVKEYRRAGADQEEPLPHELRSPEILARTMDYIVCNIMDRVEQEHGVVSDWYDFVWSRTRAIRKDITQQHLCDPISVSLLEKCARFHIHCNHALCEEDALVFDPKINNENLNKCIQSLKDFYNDLNLKDQQCPNEPEFRGYYLLLNLNRPDILREVKYFDAHIRGSMPVQFALKCHFAMTTNNFIKFFDLVKSTTYLNSCILHRYFYEVRLQAFKVMRKAYTITNQTEIYPADELIRLLGFENEDEIQSFCESIGLEYENGSVILKRGKTNDGRSTIQAVKSRTLIESKRLDKRLSEIIHGGPLPENPYRKYPLHDSFDQQGRLKKEAIGLGHDKRIRPTPSNYQEKPPQQLQQQHQSPMIPSTTPDEVRTQVVFQLAQQIFGEVIRDSLRSAIRQIHYQMKRDMIYQQEAHRIAESLLSYFVEGTIRQAHQRIIQERIDRETKARGYRAALERVSHQLCQSLISYYLNFSIKGIASQVLNERVKEFNSKKCQTLTGMLINEAVEEIVEKNARECYDTELRRKELISYMKLKRSWRLAREFFWHWRRMCLKSKRYQQIKSTFPAANIENGSPRIESLQLKRKISSNGIVETPSPTPVKYLKEETEKRVEAVGDVLKPKMFAEQVANISVSSDPLSSLEELSPLDKLRRKLQEEREMGQTLKQNIETFKFSLSFREETDNEIDEDNLTALTV